MHSPKLPVLHLYTPYALLRHNHERTGPTGKGPRLQTFPHGPHTNRKTRACALSQGMGLEEVADVLVHDKLEELGFFDAPEVDLEVRPKAAEAAAEATLAELDELEEDDDYGDDTILQAAPTPPPPFAVFALQLKSCS